MLLCKVAHADKILKCTDIRTCKNEGTSLIWLFMVSYKRSFWFYLKVWRYIMPKSSNQKLKLIYLMKILLERTDETHSITMPEIIEALAAYDISAERKSLYNDIENLRVYGLDVIGTQEDRTYSYHIGNRQFELAELKLLVDSVQSAKFITAKKSNELIKKIEGLASKYEASQLHRQVFVTGRVKTMNESIYYNVDRIHTAIAENSRITFQYFQWNVDKKMELRHDGALYEVSPWSLSWDDENYYLIAYDSNEGIIKHFRVDKMLYIKSNGKGELYWKMSCFYGHIKIWIFGK